MKTKLRVLAVLVLSIAILIPILTACSSPQHLIVGEFHYTWGDGTGVRETWIFNADGTFVLIFDNNRETGTWEILSDNELFISSRYFPNKHYYWAENENNVSRNEWFVTRDRLYLDDLEFSRR